MTKGECDILRGKNHDGPGGVRVRSPKAESKLSGSAAGRGGGRRVLSAVETALRQKEGRGRGLCNNKKEAAAAWTMVVWSRQLGITRLPGTVE